MSHQHAPVRANRRARLVIAAILLPVLLATLLGAWLLRPGAAPVPSFETTAPGTVWGQGTIVDLTPDTGDGFSTAQAETDAGEVVEVHVPPEYLAVMEPGDRIRFLSLPDSMAADGGTRVFVDFVRGPPLLLLAAVMAILVVAVARMRGLASLVGLALSLTALGTFTLPALLVGRPALPVAVVSAVGIMTVVLYLAHGISARTSAALLGTLVGVVLTAGIGAWATGAARLTGLGGENSLDLQHLAPAMPLQGVLLCGLVLAGLGVLNDVTITQASAVWELRAAAPDATRRAVFGQAMRIGRDHIASTVYTVAFAYLGASLPLTLMVTMSDRALLDVVTSGEIAEEVVRTLVGSIGLVLAIPVTTGIAALIAGPRTLGSPAPAADDPEAAAAEHAVV